MHHILAVLHGLLLALLACHVPALQHVVVLLAHMPGHGVVLLLDHLLSLLPVCLVPHGGVLEIGHGMALLCHMPVVCVLSTCSIIHITLSCLVLGLAHQLHTLALPGRM